MAKKTKAEIEQSQQAAIPEGFIPVSASGGAAWYKPELGFEVLGELLGRFKKKKSLNNQDAYFFQVMLEKPCKGMKKIDQDEESVEVDMEPGEIINLDERSALEELAALVDSGKRWRVYVKALDKVKVPGTSRTVWRMNVGKQEITSKNEPKVKPKIADAPSGDDVSFPE